VIRRPSASERQLVEAVLLEYCYLVDDQRWEELDRVYAQDVEFKNAYAGVELRGLQELTSWYRSATNPAGHMVANVMVSFDGRNLARVRSKYVTVRAQGSAGTGEYLDTLERTGHGWRITSRTVVVRAASPYPLPDPETR
jgi:3-phenylpropionate/cinnamic acid dioxygenase small subunit